MSQVPCDDVDFELVLAEVLLRAEAWLIENGELVVEPAPDGELVDEVVEISRRYMETGELRVVAAGSVSGAVNR